MNNELDELSLYSYQSIVNWCLIVLLLHFLTVPDITEMVLLKYTFVLAIIFSFINLYSNLRKIENFKDQYREITNNNIFDMKEEVSKRSILSFFNKFPSEHPYVFMSLLGLILLEQRFSISNNYYQNIVDTPILNMIYIPYLFFAVLLLVFSGYANNIVNKYGRRVFKFLFYLYSPIIFAVFISGILSPVIVLGVGIIEIFHSLGDITDIKFIFSNWFKDLSTIFWLAIYPSAMLYVSKCSWIHKYQEGLKLVPQKN